MTDSTTIEFLVRSRRQGAKETPKEQMEAKEACKIGW
jgi:hypothetical protein